MVKKPENRTNIVFHYRVNNNSLRSSIDISPEEFPANYFDRNAIYFKNHDMNNNPLRKIK